MVGKRSFNVQTDWTIGRGCSNAYFDWIVVKEDLMCILIAWFVEDVIRFLLIG